MNAMGRGRPALCAEVRREIKRLRRKGLSYREIAARLCVSLGCAWKYGRG